MKEIVTVQTGNKMPRLNCYCIAFCQRDYKSSGKYQGIMLYLGYSSRGGENWTKTDVKLACKTVFVQFSTSGGRPMLLVRHSRTRR